MSVWRVWGVRVRFGLRMREWPWNVPREVALIGTKRPPEHVFAAFRRLHGLDQPAAEDAGKPPKEKDH